MTELKLGLLADIDMLLMAGKGPRGGMGPATHRYAKANNRYLRNYE